MKNNFSIILLNAFPDKKIKSLGNKYLIKINKSYHIIDYQIQFLKSIFNDPQIIIVGGFDSKRLKKYIDNNFTTPCNITYIDHDIEEITNIGTSIRKGMDIVRNDNVWVLNANILFGSQLCDTIYKNLSHSFVLTHKAKSSIGYIADRDNRLINCYYDLPYSILDSIFIHKKDFGKFNSVCSGSIEQLYFFEVLNLCSNANITLRTVDIPSKYIYSIDSISNIEKIKKKLCTK